MKDNIIPIPVGSKATIDFENRVVIIESEEPEIIKVPENISIYKWKSTISFNAGDRLLISFNDDKQMLGFAYECYDVSVKSLVEKHIEKVPCKLTPCNREDLKAGDTAYFFQDHDEDIPILPLYPLISPFCKILNDRSYVYIDDEGDVLTCTYNYREWYKVEPIN